jgi:predicted MFS family arabinose efflux permease
MDHKDSFSSVNFIVITLLIILATTILVRGSNNMLQTTLPLLVTYNFGFSKFLVGILGAIFGLSTFFTTVVNARLNPKKRRVAFISSMILYTIVFFLYFLTDPFFVWLVTIASGATLGFMMPNLVTAAGLFPDKNVRERSISLYTTSLSLSLIIGPLYESYLLKILPLRDSFILFLPLAAVALCLSPFIHFPVESNKNIKKRFSLNYGFRTAVYLNLSYAIPFILITLYAGIFAKSVLGASLSDVTLYYTAFFSTSFLSRLTFSLKKNKSGMIVPVFLTMVLTLIGLGLIYISSEIIIFVIALALLGIPHGLSYPLSLLYLTRSYEPDDRNSANSYFFSINTIVMVAGPIIGGYTIQIIGFRETFLLIVPIALILMFLVTLTIRPSN